MSKKERIDVYSLDVLESCKNQTNIFERMFLVLFLYIIVSILIFGTNLFLAWLFGNGFDIQFNDMILSLIVAFPITKKYREKMYLWYINKIQTKLKKE